MGFPLIPDYLFDSIYDIPIPKLREKGITLLLTDLDNTLVPYSVGLPDEKLAAWKGALAAEGITLFLLSNSRKPTRPGRFAEALGIPFVGHAGKPKKGGFRRALQQMERTPEETAIVGDQIFTDILGGNRAGVMTLMVKPIEFGNVFRFLRYCLETPFRVWGKRGM